MAGRRVHGCSRAATIVAVMAACLIAPAASPAATTLGQLDPAGAPGGSCVGTSYWAQAASSAVGYTVPAGGGVISSWSHRANASSGRELGMRVFRPGSGTNFTLVGDSTVRTLTPSTVNTFDTRITVQAGDVVGLYVGNPPVVFPIDFGGGASCAYTSAGGTVQSSMGMNPEPAIGSSVNLLAPYVSMLLNVTARLEADADGDGFGDETQDACPALAGTLGGCSGSGSGSNPPPAADKTPPTGKIWNSADSVKDGSVAVKLTSTEAGTATVTGTVNVPNASKVHRLKTRTVKVAPNKPLKVKLKLTKKTRRAVYKYLRRGRTLKAGVQVVLKDPVGNTQKVKRKVRLRP